MVDTFGEGYGMRKAVTYSEMLVHHKIIKTLKKFRNGRTKQYRLVQRAKIVLLAIKGMSNRMISSEVGLHYNIVGIWRRRFAESVDRLSKVAQKRPEHLAAEIEKVLSDIPRNGRPPLFGADFRASIVGMACNKPEDYGFELSHWSLPVLRKAIITKGIVQSISCATINRILNENELKPHKSRYWLHSTEKDEEPENYKRKIHEINQLCYCSQPF